MKYYAMLRYENAIVVEVDLALDSYHLVYAPKGAIHSLFHGERLREMAQKYVQELVHPEDSNAALNIWEEDLPRFFDEGLLMKSWKHRVFSFSTGDWHWYWLTALRIDTEHPHQRKAILLWNRAENAPIAGTDIGNDSAILHTILSGNFQCRNDRGFTLVHMDQGFLGYSHKELHTLVQKMETGTQ